MKKYLNISLLLFLVLGLFSCKKDLPKLPNAGNQGTFCWEQFQNNSFDPTGEWVDSDPNDFPPCANQAIYSLQMNDHRFNVQFAKNNPNIVYYIKKFCDSYPCSNGQKYRLVKYDFCTHKEEIISASIINEGQYDIVFNSMTVGNSSEIFFLSELFVTTENIVEYEYYYSNDDMNTYVKDTGLQRFQNIGLESLMPSQGKLIYNRIHQSQSDYKFLVCDLTQNSYDTLHHLSNYYIHQWISSNQWIIKSKSTSPDFFEYNPTTEVVTAIPGLQNVTELQANHSDISCSNNKAAVMGPDYIKEVDYSSGSSTIIFDNNNYNNLLLKELTFSPDGNYLVAVVEHIKWISDCTRELRKYMLVFNIQTGDWKAVDFDN